MYVSSESGVPWIWSMPTDSGAVGRWLIGIPLAIIG